MTTNLKVSIRDHLFQPLRYTVIVVPGSGCIEFSDAGEDYFSGLLHAKVIVFSKPFSKAANDDCSSDFLAYDSLSRWSHDVRLALDIFRTEFGGEARRNSSSAPVILIGISEGGEVVPALASAIPDLAGLILVSATGMDPWVVGRLQASRLGQSKAWDLLENLTESTAPDSLLVQGRSLRYWRDLKTWEITQTLLQGSWPVLQIWGTNDELLPQQSYRQFADMARRVKSDRFCSWGLVGANHGLQTRDDDKGIRRLWWHTENWARQRSALCDGLPSH